jgi:hypothetical protein
MTNDDSARVRRHIRSLLEKLRETQGSRPGAKSTAVEIKRDGKKRRTGTVGDD